MKRPFNSGCEAFFELQISQLIWVNLDLSKEYLGFSFLSQSVILFFFFQIVLRWMRNMDVLIILYFFIVFMHRNRTFLVTFSADGLS